MMTTTMLLLLRLLLLLLLLYYSYCHYYYCCCHFNVSVQGQSQDRVHTPQLIEERGEPVQVDYFRNPSERTSTKERLVKHGSKHKIQVHTTKRNKQQQKQKQHRMHFQNKNNEKPEKGSLTQTKARRKPKWNRTEVLLLINWALPLGQTGSRKTCRLQV